MCNEYVLILVHFNMIIYREHILGGSSSTKPRIQPGVKKFCLLTSHTTYNEIVMFPIPNSSLIYFVSPVYPVLLPTRHVAVLQYSVGCMCSE